MRERSLTRAYVYHAHNEFSIFAFTFTSQFIDFLRIRGEDNAPWRTFTKAFTPNELSHSVLSQTGEEVKAKNEKQLTRTRDRTLRMHTGKRMSEEQNSEIRVQHAATQFTSKKVEG